MLLGERRFGARAVPDFGGIARCRGGRSAASPDFVHRAQIVAQVARFLHFLEGLAPDGRLRIVPKGAEFAVQRLVARHDARIGLVQTVVQAVQQGDLFGGRPLATVT